MEILDIETASMGVRILGVVLGVLAIGVGIFIAYTSYDTESPSGAFLGVLAILFGLALLFTGILDHDNTYKVKITDMNEFNKTGCEIIKQEGSIVSITNCGLEEEEMVEKYGL